MPRLQQIGGNSGDKHKQKRHCHELKSESRIVRRTKTQKKEQCQDHQGRGIAEISWATPDEVRNHGRRDRQQQRWAALPDLPGNPQIRSWHKKRLPGDSEKTGVANALPKYAGTEQV